jgi:O-antigen ligase
VLAVYMIRRFGWRGVAVAALVSLPAVLLGGRSGAEARESGEFRLESWAAGFDMIRQAPLLGVGKGMFVQYHFLTAHNSYVLAAAELGLVGYVLWAGLLYVSLKTAFVAVLHLERIPQAAVARAWALAILASTCGLMAGMLFLSLTFHHVAWIHLALCGALHNVVRRHDPTWRVRFAARDLAAVVVGALGLLAVTAAYLRLQGY